MSMNKYSVVITSYEYDVLSQNSLISFTCERQLKSAANHKDEVELLITPSELTDLIGYVAAEANHTRSKKKSGDLNTICDYLEAAEQDIKRQER